MKNMSVHAWTFLGIVLFSLIAVPQTFAADQVINTSSTVGFPILSFIIFSPLLGALLAILFRGGFNGLTADISTFIASLMTVGFSIFLLTKFDMDFVGFQFVEKVPWIDKFGIHYYLGIDGINLAMVMISAFLLPPALIATWETKEKIWPFQVNIMILQVGILGSFMALDAFLFYVFFEVMLVPLYFMIGIWGGERRVYATTKFFIYTMVGSLLLLVSLIYTGIFYHNTFGVWSFSILDWYQLSFPTNVQYVLFFGFGLAFAIKSPLFPFHTWLPDAHYEAPTLGSVELAGLLLKLGPYGIIRFVLPLFPDAVQVYMPYVIGLGLIGIIYGGLVAMVQSKLKKLIAYSSVAHMGYIVIGLFVFNMEGMSGAVIQMVNHALATGALFLCVGMLYQRTKTQEISEMGGVAHTMPIFSGFFLFFCLASIGLPGLNGFVGEVLIMLGAARMNFIYAAIAAFGVIIAAVYLLWMYQRVILGPIKNDTVRNLKDLSLRELLLLAPLAISILALGVYPQPFFDRVNTTLENYMVLVNADEILEKNKFEIAPVLTDQVPIISTKAVSSQH